MQFWSVITEITICSEQKLLRGEGNDKEQVFD